MFPIHVHHVVIALLAVLSDESRDPPSAPLAFTAVSAGFLYTCGPTSGAAAYCWGTQGSKLGDGTDLAQSAGRSSPVAVVGELIFATLSAGAAHSCGVTSAGAAYCWGSNRDGQLGDGTTINRSTPTLAGGGVSFRAISARGSHTCALTPTGAAYCWGSNQNGELGDETTTSRLTPTPVASGLTFSSVSAGFNHTCGVTPAGVGYCWGSNDHSQLGDGSTKDRPRPVRVVQ